MSSPPNGGTTSRTLPNLWWLAVVLALTLSLVAAVLPSAARAEPDAADLAAAEEQLAELERDFQVAAEDYNAAKERLSSITAEIEATRAEVGKRRQEMDASREAVGILAAELYKGGSVGSLDALLTAEGIVEATRRLDYLGLSQRSQQRLFEQLDADRRTLDRELAQLSGTEQEAAETRARMAELAASLETKVAAQEDEIVRLQEAIERARREREERERREREARRRAEEERQRLAEERASRARAAEQAEAQAGEPASAPSPQQAPAPEPDPAPAPQPSSGGGAAVQAALSKVGTPYQWGGSGPNSFDCSGLTQWAWAKAGVSLPHNSGMQYGATARVDRSDLQLGDLLFFGSPIHHVGMYIGGGQMVAAPYTGTSVRVSSINRSGYVGAGRPR